MKVDDNWRESRLLSEDIELLLGIPCDITEQYLEIIENLLIHKFIEQLNAEENAEDKDYQIELPYIGSIIISINKKQKISTGFSVKTSFYKKVKDAYLTRESPLVKQCGDILGETLAEKYILEEGETLE